MKIKRYMAASMRAALAQVRAEQGPDAVILSSRRVEEGIEVIAAVDYDEALFADATSKRAPAVTSPSAMAPETAMAAARAVAQMVVAAPETAMAAAGSVASMNVAAPTPAPTGIAAAAAHRAVVAVPASAAAHRAVVAAPESAAAQSAARMAQVAQAPRLSQSSAPSLAARPAPRTGGEAALAAGYVDMQRELKDLREMLRGEFAQMAWNDKRVREPLQARVLEQLTAMDIAPDIALSLARKTPRRTNLKDTSQIPLALLVRHLQVVDNSNLTNGGVIALVGPTGAGKTTTIAKLAARWCMQHGSRDLALVSTDSYRIGAREQLSTYARILGAPMHTANTGKELARLLDRLKTKKLVLIDTAGMGPRDVRLSEQLAALQLGAARARVLLALPAQGEGHALEEIARSFARISPAACILTKIDESASLGPVMSTTLRHRLPIAYLCNGQRVPEDLHSAHERRVWLVRAALKLKERAPTNIPQNYFANHFGRAHAHA